MLFLMITSEFLQLSFTSIEEYGYESETVLFIELNRCLYAFSRDYLCSRPISTKRSL